MISLPFMVRLLWSNFTFGFISRFRFCPLEFCKSALPASETVFVLSHENTSATSRTISFGSNNFVFTFSLVELVYWTSPLLVATCFFVCHYFLPLLFFDSAAAACLAFNFVAFSSSMIFFLASFDIFLNIKYLGSCCRASSKEL